MAERALCRLEPVSYTHLDVYKRQEVGISTSKLHARGPVGLDGLLSYKYKLIGHGDIVGDFADGKRSFTHKSLDQDCPL